MQYSADQRGLLAWVKKAELANIVYFRERRILWEEFATLLSEEGDIEIAPDHVHSIRGALLARNVQLNDDKTLAFVTAIETMHQALLRNRPAEAETH